MSIRVGIIGAGVMGSDHARNVTHHTGGATLAAIADIDAGRARSLAAELGVATTFDDPHRLIASPDVDAVIVASHDSTHAELVVASVEAGKPVLCEKPLALDLGDCAAVLEAERKAGRRLVSVGFSRRFDPANVAIRAALAAGEIGRPLLLHAVHRNVANDPAGDSASTVLNSAIHELDEAPWLLGSPAVEVAWQAPASTSLLPQRQDPQLISLRTADGALTSVEVFVNAVYGYDVRLEVVGETGTLSYGEAALVVRNKGLARSGDYPADWRPRYAESYRAEMVSWIGALTAGEYDDALASAVDGYRATAVARAVIDAMDSGSTIKVEYPHASLLERTFR